jgi:hypothetical protein
MLDERIVGEDAVENQRVVRRFDELVARFHRGSYKGMQRNKRLMQWFYRSNSK